MRKVAAAIDFHSERCITLTTSDHCGIKMHLWLTWDVMPVPNNHVLRKHSLHMLVKSLHMH